MFFSSEHNALIYKAHPLLTRAEGWRRINGDFIAVPASLDNLQRLANSGITVPSPLQMAGYDWPIRPPKVPLPHQQTTSAFLALRKRAFCFNDMGTMKTLSALWAADFLMGKENFKTLIVAPLSILKPVWGQHIWEHLGHRRSYRILHGSHERRRELLKENADFYIVNFDGLACGVPTDSHKAFTGLAADLAARSDIKLVIFDEGSAYRHPGTQRHRAARAVASARPYCWILTGTPTSQGPLDAYGLARLMGTNEGSLTTFKNRTMVHVSTHKWVPRAGWLDTVAQVLKPAIRYNSDFLRLPPCTPEQRAVPLSPEQAHAWKTLKKEAVLALRSGALVHAVNEAVLRIKLIQCAAGAIYDGGHGSHELSPGPRLAEVESIISETDRKIVIFAPLTNVLELLYHKLNKWDRVILNGTVTSRDRDKILTAFGDPQNPLRICLADPATTAHGVNAFTSANICIWYAPTDKNELYRQGIKRLDRPGQTVPVKVIQLVSTQLERDIYSRLDRNESMQGLILKFAEEK